MNEDKAAGSWTQCQVKLKEQWGKLTDDDMKVLEGNRDQLASIVQKRHGIAKEEAERQAKEFRTKNKGF